MSTRNVYAKCHVCGNERFMKRFYGIRTCRSCSAKQTNIRSNSASKAGKVGGRKTADSGKLRQFATSQANTPEAQKRRFETLKRTGKLWTSKPEMRLFHVLNDVFGAENVVHHVCVSKFRIDFYVINIDTYIELDGVYWHGLSTPYEQLKGTPKLKFDRDRKCDEHFRIRGMRLERITDIEMKDEESVYRRLHTLCASTS